MHAAAESTETRCPGRAHTLAVTWLAGIAGHYIGDYLIQRDRDACTKHHRNRAGRTALARHAATYAATQAAAKWLTYRAGGMRVPTRALLAGTLAEGLLHAFIDDGRPLRWFAHATGKGALHDLVAPGLNGRMVMDQAVHLGLQIPVGALVTTWLAGDR